MGTEQWLSSPSSYSAVTKIVKNKDLIVIHDFEFYVDIVSFHSRDLDVLPYPHLWWLIPQLLKEIVLEKQGL